jgi:hypothetical protein
MSVPYICSYEPAWGEVPEIGAQRLDGEGRERLSGQFSVLSSQFSERADRGGHRYVNDFVDTHVNGHVKIERFS